MNLMCMLVCQPSDIWSTAVPIGIAVCIPGAFGTGLVRLSVAVVAIAWVGGAVAESISVMRAGASGYLDA